MSTRRRIEVASVGFDPLRQVYGGNPFGTAAGPGLLIPPLATDTSATRYLFSLCSYNVGAGQCVRLVGLRQLLTIGVALTGGVSGTFVDEREVVSPWWSFSDANVSWHVRRLADDQVPPTVSGPLDAPSFSFMFRNGPALLYKTATFPGADLDVSGKPDNYLALTAYTPPNGGKPWGDAVAPELGDFYDLRYPWKGGCLQPDVPVIGPCTLMFFASVKQTLTTLTDVGNHPHRPYPSPFPTVAQSYPNAYAPEESYLQSWLATNPSQVPLYYRVAGAMMIEED